MTDNTIEALRIYQVGIEAVAAVGAQTWGTLPTVAKTFVIGNVTYTVVAAGASVAGEINAGANLAAWQVNVVAAINGLAAPNLTANPYASAGTFTGNVLPITARIPGAAGNAIVFTMPAPDVGNSVNGSGFLGATTPGSMGHGTAVAATTRLAVEMLDWSDEDENVYRPRVANGLLMRNRGTAAAVQHGTRFSLPDQATVWEQLPLFLAMVVDGVPVITGDVDGPWTFAFVSDPTINPNPVSVTLQRRFNNGLGETIDERAAYAMLSEFGLSFAVNEHLRLRGAGFARKFETSPITPGLTLPDFEIGVSALSTVYVDDDWAGVGATLLSEQVIGWNLTINPGIFPRHTAEGRTTLDFTKHQVNGDERLLGLELTCLLDPATYAAEQTKANAGDIRAVRVRVTGSDGRQLDVDMLMQHAKAGLWAPGVDQGQDTVTFTLEEATDLTNFLAVTLVLPETFSLA